MIKNYGANSGSLRVMKGKRESTEEMSGGSSKNWNKENNERRKRNFGKLVNDENSE